MCRCQEPRRSTRPPPRNSQETLEELEDQGIHQGTIRLSIGLENIDDIIEDLESGFKALRESGLAK